MIILMYFLFELCFQCYENFLEDEETPIYIYNNNNIHDVE